MEFRSLKAQYRALQSEIDAAMAEVIHNTNFISGGQVRQLEEELAENVGVKHCISCANGTDALSLALIAWGIGRNDAVFVPDFTFFSSGEVVSFAGASPIFVDVDQNTNNIDPDNLEAAVLRVQHEGRLKPKAIVAVDLFGQPADYPKLKEIAAKYGLKLLEDGAQGFGGAIRDQKACSFGELSTTSFFPAKPLGCYGDGGAVFTDDDEMAGVLHSLCVHGKGSFKYDNIRIGMNSRLDTLQAAVLLAKLPTFWQKELEEVNRVAGLYTRRLQGLVKTPVIREGFFSSWAQYTVQVKEEKERDALQKYLKEQGIPSMIYYPKPMHKQLAFAPYECEEGELAVTERLCRTVLALPIHPYMREEETEQVIEAIQHFYA